MPLRRYIYLAAVFLLWLVPARYLQLYAMRTAASHNFVVSTPQDTIYPSTEVDAEPVFKGGDISTFFRTHWQDTTYSTADCTSGTIIIQITIDKEGKLMQYRALHSMCKKLTAEAMRIVQLMKDWTPARRHGQPVGCIMSVKYTVELR